MTEQNLTERQAKWFASVRASLERDTGKTMGEWVEIARTCPESGHRARLKWFKETHGLLQNRASQVISDAFGSTMSWSEPEGLVDALWVDPASRAIFEQVNAAALALPDAIQTARKGYTAWSRKVQFAALKPVKGGTAMLGLALEPEADARLTTPGSESWSERLKSKIKLAAAGDVDAGIAALLNAAWDRS
jgi:hypothetical protein